MTFENLKKIYYGCTSFTFWIHIERSGQINFSYTWTSNNCLYHCRISVHIILFNCLGMAFSVKQNFYKMLHTMSWETFFFPNNCMLKNRDEYALESISFTRYVSLFLNTIWRIRRYSSNCNEVRAHLLFHRKYLIASRSQQCLDVNTYVKF